MTDTRYTSGPLLDIARNIPTVLQSDSSDLDELRQSISYGGISATCNPVIVYTIIKKHFDVWMPRIQVIADANPTWGGSEIGWEAVEDTSQGTVRLLGPIFSKHKGRNGRLLVQIDPRLHRDVKKLTDQAEEFHNLACNIVVRILITKTGFEATEDVTSRGASINVTVFFPVPQAVQAAEAIERGLKAREAAGHDTSEMGPAVMITMGHLDDWLRHVAARDGIFIDPSALEWAGIAAVKRAYQIFQECGYRARVLAAAFRNANQWAESVGGDMVVPPPFKWQKIIVDSGYTARERIADPVDSHYTAEPERILDFIRAYKPDGMTVEEFEKFGLTRKTLRQFLAADADLDVLVRDIIVPAP